MLVLTFLERILRRRFIRRHLQSVCSEKVLEQHAEKLRKWTGSFKESKHGSKISSTYGYILR